MNIRKLTAVLIAICFALSAPRAASATEAEGGKTLFEYNAATADRDFRFYERGHWHFDENGISCDNDGKTGDDAWYYTYTGVDQGWTDYIIEADFTDVGEGGIIFRTTNPTDDTVDAFDGYYIGTDSDYLFAGMDLDDAWHTISEDGPDANAAYKIGYKAQMHWKIIVQGNTFTMYLDNAKFPTIQVCDDTYKSGGIAIRYRVYPGDLSGYITNLTVREIASGSDTPAPGGSEAADSTQSAQPGQDAQPSQAADAAPDEEGDDGSLLIPIIAGGAILVIGILVVFMLASKKKKEQ